MKVVLKNQAGETQHEADLPPYTSPPQVVVWGPACYSLSVQGDEAEGPHSYTEVFGYILPAGPQTEEGMREMRDMR